MRLTGVVTVAAMAQAIERVAAHRQFRESLTRLWDIRQADVSGLTSDDLRQIGDDAIAKLATPGAHVAFLVAGDLAFGLSRELQAWQAAKMDTLQGAMRVFREAEAAEAWLKAGESDSLATSQSN